MSGEIVALKNESRLYLHPGKVKYMKTKFAQAFRYSSTLEIVSPKIFNKMTALAVFFFAISKDHVIVNKFNNPSIFK